MKKSHRRHKQLLHDLRALQELHSTWERMVGWPKEEFHDGIQCLEELLNWHEIKGRKYSQAHRDPIDLTAVLLAVYDKKERPPTVPKTTQLVDQSLLHNLSSGF